MKGGEIVAEVVKMREHLLVTDGGQEDDAVAGGLEFRRADVRCVLDGDAEGDKRRRNVDVFESS